ncbi:flavoprotein [Thiohalorhabdus methylotrophus]|uniref:Flavoprotein n=1 Tax=Thiohalorhabdus methylotrophus TaxID=3242694 RepID=A0ABV4TYL5_9GAMM
MAQETESPARMAWALTGSGHFFAETLELIDSLEGQVDIFLSGAGEEVLQQYGYDLKEIRARHRVFRDNAASSPPVGLFYYGHYHTVVIAPATSNTVAKCVFGISDTLVTNIFAQAGKCRIPSVVFACDSAPHHWTEAPGGTVSVYPRQVDLENTEKLRAFEATEVVTDLASLQSAVRARARTEDAHA